MERRLGLRGIRPQQQTQHQGMSARMGVAETFVVLPEIGVVGDVLLEWMFDLHAGEIQVRGIVHVDRHVDKGERRRQHKEGDDYEIAGS